MKFEEIYEENVLDDCRLYAYGKGDEFVNNRLCSIKFVYKILEKNGIKNGTPYYNVEMKVYNDDGCLLDGKNVVLSESFLKFWCDEG